jgi:hypothetical protein
MTSPVQSRLLAVRTGHRRVHTAYNGGTGMLGFVSLAHSCRRHANMQRLALILAISVGITLVSSAADAKSVTRMGVTFSDELGGFVLNSVTGSGSLDDPFIVTERMTDINGGTLTISVDPAFGNRIGSQHFIGLSITKVVENSTGQPWTSFELELQSELGVPSGYSDGLSFGQGSDAGRPFAASGFDQVTIVDEPYDRIEYDRGKILAGTATAFRFVITESLPIPRAYLAQRPRRPVALGNGPWRLASLAVSCPRAKGRCSIARRSA